MIVIGGMHSSNTCKLAEICGRYCKACIHIENADGLDFRYIGDLIKNNTGDKFVIGVTAGASAPVYIIKEVTNQMSEKLQNMEEDFNFGRSAGRVLQKNIYRSKGERIHNRC